LEMPSEFGQLCAIAHPAIISLKIQSQLAKK
jgi:hypothetical protein